MVRRARGTGGPSAWRGGLPSGLRRVARVAAPWAAVLALVLILGLTVGVKVWRESHWTPDAEGGVTAVAFSADHQMMVSSVGFDLDGVDTVWDVADPARPRPLGTFEGGSPTTLSPDGRTVATISFDDQPVLWDVADPTRPVRTATLPGDPDVVLWGQAFSPDGHVLAAAYTSRLDLWDVANPARPRLLTRLPLEAAAPPHWYGYPGDIAFSPRAHPGQHTQPWSDRPVDRVRPRQRHPRRHRGQPHRPRRRGRVLP